MNLFLNTKYEYAEEDRLTNAFLAVLEKADIAVYNAIADLLHMPVSAELLDVDCQHAFVEAGSRTDGRIETDASIVHIEAKYKAKFDSDQIVRHLRGIEMYENSIKPKFLLCIGEQKDAEPIKKMLSDESERVRFLSWREINRLFDEINPKDDSVTSFLISEFCYYLEGSGFVSVGRLRVRESRSIRHVPPSDIKGIKDKQKPFNDEYRALIDYLKSELGEKIKSNINNESWISQHGSYFQFMIQKTRLKLRLNCELYAQQAKVQEYPGWIGIGYWGGKASPQTVHALKALMVKKNVPSRFQVDYRDKYIMRLLSVEECRDICALLRNDSTMLRKDFDLLLSLLRELSDHH